MAHGFLTPESVSGDNFWKNAKDLFNLLQRLKKKKAPPEEVVPAVVSELQKALPPGRQKLLSPGAQKLLSRSNQKALTGSKPANMLQGAPVAKMLGAGKSEITIKQQLSLPPGGPKLPPSDASPNDATRTKGGTFTNLPGISSAPKKLDSEAFFKAAQTGVDPQTGRYLSSEERKDFLKKSKATMNAPASVASAGIASASTSITKGDEEIVSSVENLTKVVTSLVDAVKAQTSAQLKAANAQKASTERTANRALAAAEESSMEQSADLSGTLTPSGGIGSMTPGGGSGGGGLLSAAGNMVAGKVAGKAAQAVTKRGLSRALPRIGASVAGKAGARAGAQTTAKIGTNVAAKTGAKAAARMIPGVQTALGVGFAMDSFSKGDVLGGLLNLGSAIPGPLGWAFLGGSVANDLSKGGSAEVAPFEKGGIISSPTLSVMGEGNKKEGVFPLQGKEGKKTFEMFGQGMIDAQKKNKREYASIQSAGLRQYYENEGGGEKLGKSLASIWGKIGGVLGGLFSGTLNSLMGAANATEFNPAADYLNASGGTQDMMTLATVAALESGSSQGQADVAQSVYNRLADKTYGSSITDILTRQGQYQVAFKDPTASSGAGTQVADVFKNIKTEDDAVKAMMYYYNKRGQKITAEQARQKLRGSVSAIQNAELQRKAALHVGGRTEFLARGQGGRGSVSRGGGSDNDFFAAYGSGNQMKRGAAAVPTGLFAPAAGGGSPSIAAAAQSLRGMDTSGGPGGGSVSCVYAVNKVFAKAGVKPPWGGAQSTDAVINAARKAGWQQVGFNDAKPGDLWAYDANDGKSGHVGIMMPNGKVLSNSSSQKKFIWEADRSALLSEYPKNGMTPPGGVFFRPPGGGSGGSVARKPAAKPTPSTTANRGGARGSGSSPGSLQASAAAPPAGVQLAQVSTADAVSQRRNTRGGGTTIINNNNVQSGSGAQVASAAPAGGSSSMGLSALAIRLS